MQSTNEIIIKVQELAPQVRHQTIFDTFNTLKQGESLIIHNNHDPKPVYYQLMNMRGNIFGWEYLQAGPEVWDIRVTRSIPLIPNEGIELILNVPNLDPTQKHKTIMHVFEHTIPGECFFLHNDHAPQKLREQLLEKHGDSFTWEYITEGPEWWDIKITVKHKEPMKGPNGEIIVDVPSLAPQVKHATIFKTFEDLNPGESLIIHNDHDPKPVYYQLSNDYGDTFTWEYVQQGPEFWDVKVTKKGEEIMETIGEIVAKDLRKSEVFKKYGIDFCCGGKKTVKQVCEEQGLDYQQVLADLQEPIEGPATGANMNYEDWALDFLADFVVNTHHSYVRKYLPEIKQYAAKVAQVHGPQHPELHEVNSLFLQVDQEMTEHMVEEEEVLFSTIKKIVEAQKNNTQYENNTGKTFGELVRETEEEHDSVGRAMERIRKITDNYTLPSDACTSYSLLFQMLEEFESDLFIHIHLENNVLFVKAEEIEASL